MLNREGWIENRVENLYVSEQYQVYLLTGQTGNCGSRRAYVSIMPFTDVCKSVAAAFNKRANPNISGLLIAKNGNKIVVKDTVTGTESSYDVVLDKASYCERASGISAYKPGK